MKIQGGLSVSSNNIEPIHSRIGASSMHRWSVCPGSVKLSQGLANTTSKYAEEGTKAHEIAAKILEDMFKFKSIVDAIPDGEMGDAIRVYIEHVDQIVQSMHSYKILIEHKFNLSHLHPGLYGTSDCVVYDEINKILHVIDYKHGAGIPVEVENNEQLMYYGLGVLLSLNLPVNKVILTIVQPRCFHSQGSIRSWSPNIEELIDFTEDLIQSAKRTEDPNAPLKSGDHCRFCPAAFKCPELERMAQVSASMVFTPVVDKPYSPDQLAKALSLIPTLEAFISNVKEIAQAEALKGNMPTGFKLVNGRSSRDWRDNINVQEVLALTYGLSDEEIYSKKIKSVAQVEKLLSKEDKESLQEYVDKTPGGLVLAPLSDKRQPALAIPSSVFKIIGDNNV